MITISRQTYFSPTDNCDAAVLNAVRLATKSIRLCDYGYSLANLTQELISLFKGGVDVSMVLDSSQSTGSTEAPEVALLKASGIPLVIGESSDHKIVHSKYIVIDDETVVSGSYNFSNSAELEDNFVDIELSPERAANFTNNWQTVHDWIVQNEPNGVFNQ